MKGRRPEKIKHKQNSEFVSLRAITENRLWQQTDRVYLETGMPPVFGKEKKMKTRVLNLLWVCALLVLANPLYAQQPKLTVWISWEGSNLLKDEITQFAKTNNYSIEVNYIPKIKSKLSTVARAEGTLPDVFMIKSDYVSKLSDYGVFEDLKDVNTNDLTKKGIKAFKYHNKLTAIPFYFDTQVMLYNKSVVGDIDALSLSTEQLEKIAHNLKAKGIIPLAWNLYSAYWLLPFQVGFGKDINDPQNIAVINDKATGQALTYLIELKNQKLLFPLFRGAIKSKFIDNKIGFILTGSYAIPSFRKAGLNLGILTFPFISNTQRYASPLLDFKGFSLSKNSKHKREALQLINYLVSRKVQLDIAEKLYKIPANTSVWSAIRDNSKYFKVFFKSYTIGSVIPPSYSYVVYKNTMWKILRFVVGGKLTVEEGLNKGQKIIDTNLKPSSKD